MRGLLMRASAATTSSVQLDSPRLTMRSTALSMICSRLLSGDMRCARFFLAIGINFSTLIGLKSALHSTPVGARIPLEIYIMAFHLHGCPMKYRNRAIAAACALISCGWLNAAAADFGPSNPFYAPSTLPFGAPPFDRIKDEDYQPAIEAGMAQELAEINAIANNPAPPTFENTFVAMEKSGRLLHRALAAFRGV